MHNTLRDALPGAVGSSDLVIVAFLDVRGFSSFAGMAESSEAAIFLRRMYIDILDRHFPDAAFFKPTGDGLMIIRHYDKDNLAAEVEDCIRRALELVDEFPTITTDDPMVNFDVPGMLGVGIARGAATRLGSGDLTLDYSGRPLNLAARLMDLARPSGVVLNSQLIKGIDLPDDLMQRFTAEQVYVRGTNDSKPLDILASQTVKIPFRNRSPLDGRPFETKHEVTRLSELEKRGGNFIHTVRLEPLDPDQVELVVMYPKSTSSGRKTANLVHILTRTPKATRRTAAGWELTFDYDEIVKIARGNGVKSAWEVRVFMRYMTCEADPESMPTEDGGALDAGRGEGDAVPAGALDLN